MSKYRTPSSRRSPNPYIEKFKGANTLKEVKKRFDKLNRESIASKVAITVGLVALGALAFIAGAAIMIASAGTATVPGGLLLGAGFVTVIGALTGGPLAMMD